MEEKQLETTTVDLAAGPYGLRATATRTLFDGFSAVYTEGRDDAEDEAERTLPALRAGDVTDRHRRGPDAALHRASAALHGGDAWSRRWRRTASAGRSTYAATISTIVDRGYVAVRERRLYPEPVAEIVTDLLVDHFGEYVDLEFTARMEEELDEVARGERAWVPLLEAFYAPLRVRVETKRRELRRADFTTEATDEVCSLGHPMVIRLGRNGRFLACSLFPEHKESRPLPGEEQETPALPGVGETCPTCGATDGGELVARRGRFGPFVGCNRYPDCSYIKRDGPPPPAQLPFEVACPTCQKGHLVARRARRDGSVFWGCSRYPTCRYTTSREPLGPVHDPDGAPLGRLDDATALCLGCGATIALAGESLEPGRRIAGGTPDPAALARPSRARGGGRGNGEGSGAARRRGPSRAKAARPA